MPETLLKTYFFHTGTHYEFSCWVEGVDLLHAHARAKELGLILGADRLTGAFDTILLDRKVRVWCIDGRVYTVDPRDPPFRHYVLPERM